MSVFRRLTKASRENGASAPGGLATVHVLQGASQSTVVVTGRLTVDSSPYLRSQLLAIISGMSGPVMIVDLSAVSYMDTSGLATLLEALSAARDHSVRLRLTGISGQPRQLAELGELDKICRALGSEVELS